MKIQNIVRGKKFETAVFELGEFLIKLSVAMLGIAALSPYFRDGQIYIGGFVTAVVFACLGIYCKTIIK
jgi:hypothetical protein